MNHALILPILLPAVVGAVLVIAARYDRVLARVFAVASMLLMLAIYALATSTQISLAALIWSFAIMVTVGMTAIYLMQQKAQPIAAPLETPS